MQLRNRDLSKPHSNGVQALKDMTLTIPAGKLGRLVSDGAAKSALMGILARLQEPDQDSIRLADRPEG